MRFSEVITVVRLMPDEMLRKVAQALGTDANPLDILERCYKSRQSTKRLAEILYAGCVTPQKKMPQPRSPPAVRGVKRLVF